MPAYFRVDGVDPEDLDHDAHALADRLFVQLHDAGYDVDGVVPVVNESAHDDLVRAQR